MASEYIWTRREGESSVAYEAFREYLNQGPKRSGAAVGEALGKSTTLMERWCAAHDWVARALAYDQYMASAATDGLASQMASARDDNLTLAATLRGHLSTQLTTAIERKSDPSVRWSQALVAMIRLEEHAFRLKDDPKVSALRDRAKELIQRMEDLANK